MFPSTSLVLQPFFVVPESPSFHCTASHNDILQNTRQWLRRSNQIWRISHHRLWSQYKAKLIFCWSSQNLENSQNPNFSPPAPYETSDPVSLSAAGCERAWNSAPLTPTPPFSSHCTQICFFALSVLFRKSGNVSSFQKGDDWIAGTRSSIGFLSWTIMPSFYFPPLSIFNFLQLHSALSQGLCRVSIHLLKSCNTNANQTK